MPSTQTQDSRSTPTRDPARRPQLRRSANAVAQTLAQGDGRLGWAPVAAALAIDLADLATAGPIGLVMGLFVGAVLTTMVSLAAGARLRQALGFGMLGALYCALPMTEAIPLATMLTLVHGFLLRQRNVPRPQIERGAEHEGEAEVVEVEVLPGGFGSYSR